MQKDSINKTNGWVKGRKGINQTQRRKMIILNFYFIFVAFTRFDQKEDKYDIK